MKRCPYCGQEIREDYPTIDYIKDHDVWLVSHFCPHEGDDLSVCISVYGKTREEAIERWNHRAEIEESKSL